MGMGECMHPLSTEALARRAMVAFTGYDHDGPWPSNDRVAIKWEFVARALRDQILEAGASLLVDSSVSESDPTGISGDAGSDVLRRAKLFD